MLPLFSRYCLALFALAAIALGQTSIVVPNQAAISVTPGFDHAPLRLGLGYAGNAAADFARLSVTSDSPWVAASISAQDRTLVLAFATGDLVGRSHTATLTVSDGIVSAPILVQATVSPLNVTVLADDPVRSRMYAIQQDGAGIGSVLVIDPLTLNPMANLSVGRRPVDFSISADGSEMLVLCSVDKTITVVDLRTLTVRETITLPAYGVPSNPANAAGHIRHGPADIIYYVDGSWGPVLHTLRRSSRTELQAIFFNGLPFGGDGTVAFGFGDIVVSPDRGALYGWSQFGTDAGIRGSHPGSFTITPGGTLSVDPQPRQDDPYTYDRDPLNTPALISRDGRIVILKYCAYEPANLTIPVRRFPAPIFAISPAAEIVSTSSAIYDYLTGRKLCDLPGTGTVQAITSDYARLIFFDTTSRVLKSVDLFEKVGLAALRLESAPAHQALVPPPKTLQWTPLAGASRYRVYLGTSQPAVAQADPASPHYLGETSSNSLPLATGLASGATYYWRVDTVLENQLSAGPVQSFTVSHLTSSKTLIETTTVHGHTSHPIEVNLSAAIAREWTATTSAPWIKLRSDSGTTPATLRATLDASALPAGLAQGEIRIADGGGAFAIPVRLRVEPLAITVIRSDPRSTKVYAISEATPAGGGMGIGGAPAAAYLLELDSLARTIDRVVPVGTSVTDLALHEGDQRIYVTNWRDGALLALDRNTLALARAYPFSPFAGSLPRNDAYRISAAGPGRLVVEESYDWIRISVMDTNTGARLSRTNAYRGGGRHSPDQRHYFHGEEGFSGAELIKFSATGDSLTKIAARRPDSSAYYGSESVVISEDGSRVFWAGSVFSAATLAEEWLIRDEIHAASHDGRYAFSETKIYDLNERRAIFGMPSATRASAYNSKSNRLIVQQEQRIAFIPLDPQAPLAAPVLVSGSTDSTSIKLGWTHDGLQNGFTLQMRVAGNPAWHDVTGSIASTLSSRTVTGLQGDTAYEFRLRADNGAANSAWSNTLSATTAMPAPMAPRFTALAASGAGRATLTWATQSGYDELVVERRAASDSAWITVATLAAPAREYVDTGLIPSVVYMYQLKNRRRGIDSEYSELRFITLQPSAAPAFTQQPRSQTVSGGVPVTLAVTASGTPEPTFQWYRNGEPIPGATRAVLRFTSVSPLDAGTYKVVATSGATSTVSDEFTVTVNPSPSRLINFSVLADVGPEEKLTVGFTLAGGPKNLLVRGLGPTLGGIGVAGALPDPQLTVYRHTDAGAVALLSNNDWALASNRTAIALAATRVGALPFVSDASRDSAAYLGLDSDGGHSMQVSSATGGRGLALAEAYDTDTATRSRLSNISALMPVAAGRMLTTGFVISGSSRATVLIRAVGPGLAQAGVAGYLPDPQLTVYRQNDSPQQLGRNNDWESATNRADILAATTRVTSLSLPPGSKDASFVANLEPGAYTAQATSADGSSGLVLIEVYEVR